MLLLYFKQKTAYEMRISDWSADVCSSDLSRRLVEDIEAEEAEVGSAAMQGAERQILLAANIIRRIREMVADQGCAYEETSLSEIVNDALSLIAVANEYPSLMLTQEIGPAADMVVGDKVQIQLVMLNLVRSACDAVVG